jgi:phosphate acetyltransferase
MLDKPLIRAAAMVAAGEAEAMVAGAAAPTRRVIEAAGAGHRHGRRGRDAVELLPDAACRDGRDLIFADCAVNVAPMPRNWPTSPAPRRASAEALLGAARLALLSFPPALGRRPSVERVRAPPRRCAPRGFARGPVQADAALNPAIAAKKGLGAAGPPMC